MNKEHLETSIRHDGKELTVEKLRGFPGCENYSDEDAEQAVLALHNLSKIILEIPQIKNYIIDNQYVVYLDNEKNKAA